MMALLPRFIMPANQWIELDGKLLRYDRRGRDRERRLVFEGVDGVPADMTDAALLEMQQATPQRLRLLTATEASDRLENVGRPRVTILDNDPDASDAARRRLDYVRAWERAGCPPRVEADLGPLVDAAFESRRARRAEPIEHRAPSSRQVIRWIAQWLASGRNIDALVPQGANKGNFNDRMNPTARDLFERVVEDKYLVDTRPTAVAVHAHVRVAFANHNSPLLDGDKLQVPSLKAVYRHIQTIDRYTLDCARLGPRKADINWRPKGSAPQTTRHNEIWEIDHTPVDAIVVDALTRLPIGRPLVTCALDRHTRMVTGIHLGFDAAGTYPTLECLRTAVLPKAALLASCPDIKGAWPCMGTPEILVPDQGREFKARSFIDACLSLGIEVHYAPVLKAWYKGKIERFFRTLAQDVFHRVPGTTFANFFARNKEAIPETVAVVTLDELRKHVVQFIVDVYHQRRHRGIGTSPMQAWTESVERHGMRPLPNPERVMAALSQVLYRVPQSYGIEFEGLIYNSPLVAAYRVRPRAPRSVRVAIDPANLASIRFLDPDTNTFVEVPIKAAMRDRVRGVTLEKHKLARALQRANEEALGGEDGLARAYTLIDRAMDAHGRQGGLANRREAARYWEAIKRAHEPEEAPAFDTVRSASPITDGLYEEAPPGGPDDAEVVAEEMPDIPAPAIPPRRRGRLRRVPETLVVAPGGAATPAATAPDAGEDDLDAAARRMGMTARVIEQ